MFIYVIGSPSTLHQAMVYVIAACADQSELINANLPSTAPNKPYHLLDVLPGGEDSLLTNKMTQAFGRGDEVQMTHMIVQKSTAETIRKFVWHGDSTAFGLVVRSVE